MRHRNTARLSVLLGGILDTDYFGPEIPLRLRIGEEMQDIPVETVRRKIDGVDVLQRIVVHTNPEIVYENPFRDYAIDDWCVGHASEIMSPRQRGAQGRASRIRSRRSQRC